MGSWKETGKQRQSSVSFIQNLLLAHWRSLLLLFVGVYLPLQVFELLAVKLWQYEAGFPWDLPILLAVHSTAQPQLDIVAVVLTKLGSFWTALPILSAIAVILWQQKRWRSLVYLVTTAIGSTVINRTAKELMHRVRPHLWESGAPEFDFAFPSGHAMTSMTLVVILLILTWATSWRWLVLVSGSLFIMLIAWTRLYLGVHFPSDILAGWMVAIAWTIGVSIIIKPNLTQATALGNQTQAETSLLPEESQ
ncbi:phosphatase PAP2 family protein [Nostoc sp. TCL26-01]|uniref:phosphatase PAP2 family protein n=1 Tax=Nostoc sp. TCL26-01 TaxID=2576904 RepID=UPI0015C0E541|nr:phosphatase PAP2 family protein [Nostoc sp. TCL26-01]QLE54483.1 phosphatase PAP2 family protein [Nostoc sp. TCL26-01]